MRGLNGDAVYSRHRDRAERQGTHNIIRANCYAVLFQGLQALPGALRNGFQVAMASCPRMHRNDIAVARGRQRGKIEDFAGERPIVFKFDAFESPMNRQA
jgi:hypothetical protein